MRATHPLTTAIDQKLRSGEWRAGDRLPTERDLCDQFGVSRSTVRRVLSEFKSRKLISQIVGSGTYVNDAIDRQLEVENGVSALGTSPAELMEARLALEPAIVSMVVGKATFADFARMEQCCDRAEAATTLEEFERWDGLLHEVIAESAHNDFILNVFRLINQARSRGEWGQLKKRSVTLERRLAYQVEHRAIVSALRDRDAAEAMRLTVGHLVHVRRNLLGS